MTETIVCGSRQRMGTPEAPNTPARSFPLSTPSRRCQPQAMLNAFQDAVDRAESLRRMQIGRPSNGTVDCVLKLVNAERLKATNILAAADRALAELQG
jgi:hypothetical protein